MTKEYYLIIGWLLGILSMLIREKIQEIKERRQKELDIISDNLKFIFHTRNVYNNFHVDKKRFEHLGQSFPEKSSKLEKEMYENFDNEIKEKFFPQLLFHTFQLKRLQDKSFWKNFETIMKNYEELGKLIMAQESEDVILRLNVKINNLNKAYINKCLAKTKV